MAIEHPDPRPWDVLSSSFLYRKPWMTLRSDRVRLSNGTIIDDFNILEYPDWVNVVAVTGECEVVLVRQYRHGIRDVFYELPAGVCDAEDPGHEESARRELLEETGYGGGVWSPLMTLSANPSTHSNRNYSFLAVGVERLQEPQLEDTEEIHVHPVSLDELRRILDAGEIMQALHVAPLLRFLSSPNS
ncbi:NUDIX hydrolase [Singulisphaera sp. PoT]|uniref:NUDIX hydrolase n=1 Tax=Singulisphaera sp. PoT TaxID=3411797 RepID=UPI003BF5505F